MSQFATSIPQEIRDRMSVCPPPMYACDGALLRYGDDMVARYQDIAAMKRRILVHVCDEYDGFEGRLNMHMTIRCLSCDADLELIMRAAQHLGLVYEYSVKRDRREGLDPAYESGYIDVRYSASDVRIDVDEDHSVNTVVHIPYVERRRIWRGLFEAMGYRVKFDDALNIRKQSL